jgi:hypothetical protein
MATEGDGEPRGWLRAQRESGIRSTMPSRRRRRRDRNARSSRQGKLAAGELRLAERAGFEPAVRFPVHTLSKRAP